MKVTTQETKIPAPLACDCGGNLQPATLETYDFSRYVGFKVTLSGMEGLRCDKCGWGTLDGAVINHVLNYMVVDFTRFPRLLNGNEARFLRRRLELTQDELRVRMGVDRVTVAKWECGTNEISPQHDFILRLLALNGMASRGLISVESVSVILGENFKSVQTNPPEEATFINMRGVDATRGLGPIEKYELLASAG